MRSLVRSAPPAAASVVVAAAGRVVSRWRGGAAVAQQGPGPLRKLFTRGNTFLQLEAGLVKLFRQRQLFRRLLHTTVRETRALREIMQDTTAAAASSAADQQLRPATLHVLSLSDSPPNDRRWGDWWLLKDPEGEVSVGDLVHFEDQLTGAGECEGLRWALPAEQKGRWRLVPGDVETPVFPANLEQLTGGRGEGFTLRQLYEPGLEQLMALQGFSLADHFGGDTSEFWATPDMSFKYPGTQRDADLWQVDLSSCTKVSAHSFDPVELASESTAA